MRAWGVPVYASDGGGGLLFVAEILRDPARVGRGVEIGGATDVGPVARLRLNLERKICRGILRFCVYRDFWE